MKTYKNLFSKIVDEDNIRLAHRMARKDKSHYREVKMVDKNEDYYVSQIKNMLTNGEYKINAEDYTTQIIHDKGKERELWKLKYYPHRIIQWAIMLQLEPIFMKVFCNHTCASIKGRGIHHAYKLTKKYLKDVEGTKYCLKIDIKKFYPSIDHSILKRLLREKIGCEKTLALLDMIIDSYPGEKGVPIGSYLSQYLANYYLSFFDHYVKEILGCKYVVRYMDDIIFLSDSKEKLHTILHHITKYFKAYKLEIKNNYQIFPVDKRGIDFVGYRFFHKYRLLRKITCKRMKGAFTLLSKESKLCMSERCSANSYIGWIIRCDRYRLYEKYVKPICDVLISFYYGFINGHKDYPQRLFEKQYISCIN